MLGTLLHFGLWLAFQDVDEQVKSANLKLEKTDFQGALEDFTIILRNNPDRADAYVGRGRAHAALNSLVEALDDFTRATDVDSRHAPAYYYRAWAQHRRSEYSFAVRDYAKCLELGLVTQDIHAWQAACLVRLGRFEEAETAYTTALGLGPHTPALFLTRSWTRYQQANLCGAVSDATRAIHLDPDKPTAYSIRAKAYFGLHSWENALRDSHRTLALAKAATDSDALWVFLSRARAGEWVAALHELKIHLAATPAAAGFERTRQILKFHAKELTESEFINGANDADLKIRRERTGLYSFHIGVQRLLSGRTDEGKDLFRKTREILEGTAHDEHVLARAELAWIQREDKKAVIKDLEARLRALKPFEASFSIDIHRKADQEHDLSDFRLIADMEHEEALMVVKSRNHKEADVPTIHGHLKGSVVTSWAGKGPSDTLCHQFDLSLLRNLIREFESELNRILPPEGSEEKEVPRPALFLGLFLQGKPSMTEQGSIAFRLGFAAHTASWLEEPLRENDATLRVEADTVTFTLPSRRKTIVVDRATGLLRSLEALDFDGTTRHTVKRVSLEPLSKMPSLILPGKPQPSPIDLPRLQSQWFQQEEMLLLRLFTVFERWERIAKEDKEGVITNLITKWGAAYLDGLHAYTVRKVADFHIAQALNLGTPTTDLLKDADRHARQFAGQFPDKRKEAAEFMNQQISGLLDRAETTLIEGMIDNRVHTTLRRILRQAFDIDTLEKVRRETYGDRLEELYKLELESRAQL